MISGKFFKKNRENLEQETTQSDHKLLVNRFKRTGSVHDENGRGRKRIGSIETE